MHPILFKLGSFAIPSYGVMILVGVAFALIIGRNLAVKQSLPLQPLSDLALYTLLVALLGARLLLVITDLDQFIKNPRTLTTMLTSAGNFFGGLIAGTLFALIFIKRKKLPLLKVLDTAAPAIAIGHFFGRIGCLLAGCCWGRGATECAVAISFHSHEAQTGVPLNQPLYPTQAFEAVFNLLLSIALILFFKHRRFPGQLFSFYLMGYGFFRFVSEYFRGDSGRGYLFGDLSSPFSSLSIPQVMALTAIAMGIVLLQYAKRKQA